ncbi:MAG: FecR family protein [Zoogloeaceae bacterium]|jgi:hypothetical protein|nr:FecR family protein [Zoogloeaceae bacterium]
MTQDKTRPQGRIAAAFLAAALLLPGLALAAPQGEEAGKIVLAVGDVRMNGKALKEGEGVPVGAELVTGKDGYLYLKTIDNGFLILRPGSQATVEAYQVDTVNPQESRFKFSLRQGVARSISGEAVGKARKNFRFNTPVAAIGVRGTDFSVYADARETRVAVISGGVIVSGFNSRCTPQGAGPCEGGRELFAQEASGILQVQKGRITPQLLKGDDFSPDLVAPPRQDEPEVSDGDKKGSKEGSLPAPAPVPPAQESLIKPPGNAASLDPMKPIIWGRWQEISDRLPATVDISAAGEEDKYVTITLGSYVLLRDKNSAVRTPLNGSVSFSLQNSIAHVTDPINQVESEATLSNGILHVNFEKTSFSTQMNLNALGTTHRLSAIGQVTSNGLFFNDRLSPGNNMIVRGALFKENEGMSAGYLFQSQLQNGLEANGVTLWGK